MNDLISLNGMWDLGYCEQGRGIRPPYTLKCPVPGDVRMALIDAGIIQEPLLNRNTLDCRWLETKEFWYRRIFTLDAVSDTARKILTFHGLDCTADIWLNNVYLGRHDNAFVEIEYDVSSYLAAGENILVVRIDSGVNEAKKHPIDDMYKMWNNEQPCRAWMRKPQFVYGWDWTPRLETCGIWRDVMLTMYEQASFTDIYIHQADNSAPAANGSACVQANSAVPAEGSPVRLQADITLDKVVDAEYMLKLTVHGDARYDDTDTVVTCMCVPVPVGTDSCILEGQPSASHEPEKTSSSKCSVTFTIPDAKLWWSNGLGNPYLYRIELTLCAPDGAVIQRAEQDYGIRSVSLCEEILSDTESGFTFMLNGVPVFCKGADHVPADCLIGRITSEKIEALVALAAGSHMNMLRVWGGGFYESETFMRACDRRGIMVWHDFMFACGYYPDHDDAFVENVREEAVRAVKRLRRHTSLIGWSGNNEIQEMYRNTMSYDPLARPYGMKLFGEVLPAVVREYCPDLVYRESSPFGGEDPAGSLCGDQHIWHFTHRPLFEHYLDLVHFTDFPIKFLSEFGVIGAMSIESTKKSMPDASDADSVAAARTDICRDSAVWLHHCNTSSDHRIMDLVMNAYFDNVNGMGLQEYILKSQALQAEITKYLYEEFRRRKFVCSGLLFWTLSDSWGIHNWSLIDYYLDKKPIYYALKRAMCPIEISVRGYCAQSFEGMRDYRGYFAGAPAPLEIWLSNDTLQEESLTARYTICDFDGHILFSGEKNVKLAPNISAAATTVPVAGLIPSPERTVMHAEVFRGEELLSDADYFFAPYKELDLRQATVTWHTDVPDADGSMLLHLTADSLVWMAHIGGTDRIDVSDNDFHMLPGKEYVITVMPRGKDCPGFGQNDGAGFVPELHSAGTEPRAVQG